MPEQLTLKQWRKLRDMSRETLAEKSGVSERSIYDYERNSKFLRSAKYETVRKLSEVLEVSVDDIFLEATSENPK